jgi:hypothetical protein
MNAEPWIRVVDIGEVRVSISVDVALLPTPSVRCGIWGGLGGQQGAFVRRITAGIHRVIAAVAVDITDDQVEGQAPILVAVFTRWKPDAIHTPGCFIDSAIDESALPVGQEFGQDQVRRPVREIKKRGAAEQQVRGAISVKIAR